MIEAKWRKMDRESRNVQVALPRNPEDSISLVDKSGVFHVVERRHEVPTETIEPTGSRETSRTPELVIGSEEIQTLTQERDELQGRVDALTEENANFFFLSLAPFLLHLIVY